MKKSIALLILVVLLATTTALAEIRFDISGFESSGKYDIEFDDMNDTGEIAPKEGGGLLGFPTADESDDGLIVGSFDIKFVEDLPPLMRLSLYYEGEDWIFTDHVILKPADTRYTFEVDRNTKVSGGKVYEGFVVVFTDESIAMVRDIVENGVPSVRCRLDGERDVDLNLLIDLDTLTDMYNLYVESGALENDFSKIKLAFPCAIK